MSEMNLDDFYFEDSYIKGELKDIDLSGLTAGKYLRSRLLYLSGNLFQLNENEKIKLGRVAELVHNATLTHDDVIDNSSTRRGNPSIPALINNKKSVLLGDYMLARSLYELSEYNNPRLMAELTLTLKELVEGEWIQYENTNPYQIGTALYTTLALKKTGSLFRWCFIAPHVLKNPKNEDYELLSEFGEKLGIIFQKSDDIIDFNKESKKSYGLDFRNNNINYVLHYVGKGHKHLEEKFLRTEDITELNDADKAVLHECIVLAKAEMKKDLVRCHEILKILEEKPYFEDKAPLQEFGTILDLITDRVF